MSAQHNLEGLHEAMKMQDLLLRWSQWVREDLDGKSRYWFWDYLQPPVEEDDNGAGERLRRLLFETEAYLLEASGGA